MIARHWHGVVRRNDEEAFEKYLKNTVIPNFLENAGFMDHNVIKKYDFGIVHFNVITYWQNLDYLQQFAGKNIQKTRYFEEDLKYIVEKDDLVKHYEVIDHVLVTT